MILFITLSACGQNNSKTYVVTPEGIGQYLFESLLNRSDIRGSSIVLDIVDTDFTDSYFADVMAIAQKEELRLLKLWEELLHCADSLNIDGNSVLLKTYFMEMRENNYRCLVVLQNADKYYSFTFRVYDEELKIMDIVPWLNESDNPNTLKEKYIEETTSYTWDSFEPNPNMKPYSHNKITDIKINTVSIPSLNAFIHKFSDSVEKKNTNDSYFKNDTIAGKWKVFMKWAQEYDSSLWTYKKVVFNNLLEDETDSQIARYAAYLKIEMESEEQFYSINLNLFSIGLNLGLIDNEWKITEVFPVDEY